MEINVTGISSMDGVTPVSRVATYPATPNSETGKTKPGASQPEPAVKLSLSPEAQQLLKSYKAKPKEAEGSTNGTSTPGTSTGAAELSKTEEQTIRQLQTRDLHVKMHEQQHMAAAGAYARGGPTFQYQIGPDGKAYAVGGEVKLDISPVPNNPKATITKAQTIRRSALAPADPSGADRAIAAAASRMEMEAKLELMEEAKSENKSQTGSTSETDGNKRRPFQLKAYQSILQNWRPGQMINFKA